MSRFSPTVRPEVPAPLDFRGLSDSLRGIRDERRQRQLDDERRAEIAEERAVRTRAEQRAIQAEQERREAARLKVIQDGWLPGSRPAERAPSPSAAETGYGGWEGEEGAEPPRGDVRAPHDAIVESKIGGETFFYDPLQARKRAAATEEEMWAARRGGEKTATYNAAIAVGVPEEEARRYVFGPSGLTVGERKEVDTNKAALNQQQLTYVHGSRLKLMAEQHKYSLALQAARKAGDGPAGKAAANALKIARDRLADQDRLWGVMRSQIPDDPYDLKRQLDDPNLGSAVQEAMDWVDAYTRTERPKLQADVDEARAGALGGQPPATPSSGAQPPPGQAGAVRPDGKRPVAQEWWDRTFKQLAGTMGEGRARAYMDKNFVVR